MSCPFLLPEKTFESSTNRIILLSDITGLRWIQFLRIDTLIDQSQVTENVALLDHNTFNYSMRTQRVYLQN